MSDDIDEAGTLTVGMAMGLSFYTQVGRPELMDEFQAQCKQDALRLKQLLDIPEIGGPLSLANPQPCEVAGVVAESYSMAVACAMLNSYRPTVDKSLVMQCCKEYERATGKPCGVDHKLPATGNPKKPTADDLMMAELAVNLDATGWSCQRWADRIGRAKSTVAECATWKRLELMRLQTKAERRRDRRRKKPNKNDK